MTLDEYQVAAIRTMDSANRTREQNLVNCGLGLAGEAAELYSASVYTPESVAKEMGDVLWYVAATARLLGVRMSELSIDNLPIEFGIYELAALFVHAGQAADVIKKHISHGHALDASRLRLELSYVLYYMDATVWISGKSLAQISEMNIRKLEARYPNGFSTEASIARKDVAK